MIDGIYVTWLTTCVSFLAKLFKIFFVGVEIGNATLLRANLRIDTKFKKTTEIPVLVWKS